MAFDAHKNLAVSTIATAPSPATSGTSGVVAAGEGARFPAVPFNATIWPVNTLPTPANSEIVRVTAISTDTFTWTRAQEGTSARTVIVGDQIAATITVKTLEDLEKLQKVVDLTDGATPALDASLGSVFRLSAAGDRTIAVPSNPTAGQKIIIRHLASGGARTLSLNTGTGGFRYGNDISALTQTTSGKVDYIGAIYDATDNKWDVVAYAKGY